MQRPEYEISLLANARVLAVVAKGEYATHHAVRLSPHFSYDAKRAVAYDIERVIL